MLVFNCTKAAAEFFSVTRKGEKISDIEPAPHKTIAESITTPVFPKDVDPADNNYYQWQWVVHCVSIQRKKYLIAMDYHSRYSLVIPAGKKGDTYHFLNSFEPHLKANFLCIAEKRNVEHGEIEVCLDNYDRMISSCAFHHRNDRSVQGHINDVVLALKDYCEDYGPITAEIDTLAFNLNMGQVPRKTKGQKDYFFPEDVFIDYWWRTFVFEPKVDNSNVIDLKAYREKMRD